MADVSVEFGAKDTGLEQTLQRIQGELTDLKGKVTSGELSMTELEQTMKRIGQVENMEKRLRAIGGEAAQTENKVEKLNAELKQIGDGGMLEGMSKSWGKITGAIAGVTAALGTMRVAFDFTTDAIKKASDLGETQSKVNVIFGEGAQAISSWAKTTAASIGQSQQSAMDAASTFATFGKSAGLAGGDLVDFSKDLVALSSDFASFSNATPEEAIQAIGAALRGESEPIRRFGVLLDEATLKASAMKMGLISTTKEALTPQQKVLAAYNEILAQSGDAQGDFARTSDGLANQMRTLQANVDNLSASFGQTMIPVVTEFTKYLNENTIPALIGAGAYMSEMGSGIKALGKETGLSNEQMRGLTAVFDKLLNVLVPGKQLLSGVTSAQELLAQKGREVQQSQKEAAQALANVGNASVKASEQIDKSVGAINEDIHQGLTLTNEWDESLSEFGGGFKKTEESLIPVTGLLDSAIGLTDSLNTNMQETLQTLGGINTQEELRAELQKLIKDGQDETNKGTDEALENAKKLALDELAIVEAKARGNDLLAEQLEKQAVLNQAYQEGITKLGMTEREAQKYATRMAEAAYPVKTIRNILDEIAQKKIDNPVKTLGEQTDETKAKLKEMAGVLGQDLSRYNFSDVMKKLGLDSFGLTTTKEKIDAINAELKRIEEKPVGIAVDVKEESVKDVEAKIAGIGKDPIQTRLDVDKTSLDAALAQTKVEMQNEFVSTASASGGDGGEGGEGGEGGAATLEETIMDKIQTAVEAIRVAVVEKIEPKLPTHALTT